MVPREVFTWFPERFYLVPRKVLNGSSRGFTWFLERFYLVPRKILNGSSRGFTWFLERFSLVPTYVAAANSLTWNDHNPEAVTGLYNQR